METGTPSLSKVVTMVLFALSCAGLLLFLWLSFGGTIPFNPQGYRIRVSFQSAGQLATQADVRIAGVTVGKVIYKSLDPNGNRTFATLQIQNKYAPIRSDARAILREKTILGETYVEMSPGSPNAKPVPDGGLLRRGEVQPAVQLDEVFNALDPATRKAFQVWQQQLALSVKGNDQNLNNVLGNLPQFAADATDILRVLDVEHSAVVRLVQNGGTVFSALSQDQSALRNLVTSAGTTFRTTAANNNALAATFKVFPTFLTETKATMTRLKAFSLDTDPLAKALLPVASDLGPTLHSVQVLSPDLRRLFVNLGPLITVSKTGLPGIRDVLLGAKPLLGSLGPFLEQLNPILTWLSLHQQLVSDFISNGAAGLAAKTVSVGGGGVGHYLRQFSPVGPETLSFAPARDANNRGNTYPPPLWLADPNVLRKDNLPSWDCNNTGSGPVSAINAPVLGRPACWVAPPLPGARPGQIPHIQPAKYSSK
ncbi:MAG: phospholipid/cholesterol/gamma-HCH transport system substrate-binding protein [Solirubrobacteraceae bacterium]|nr:phospholipid/cholesterol/gamma-HCH transport system substrate-binding protein [Solirubrobacteraceae bacterium]